MQRSLHRRGGMLVLGLAVSTLGAGLVRGEDDASTHWAFRPVSRVRSPLEDPWVATPVDSFVLARLRQAELEPSPEADRHTLVRRACFVLHGIAPSPELVERYVEDASPDWYAHLIDELLASSRFGERMARHWLDLVRYAESNGFETNRPRPNAWPYRDWVIRAFNDDMPYDRFVTAQLAGDVSGEPLGTGFLVAGPYDIVKSPDEALTKMQRADELADFVNATSTVFVGLTVACAKCHDHKFDPIPQEEYYSMAAVFAGVEHGDRQIPREPSPESRQRLGELRERTDAIRRELATLPVREPVDARMNTEVFPALEARFVRFSILETNSSEPCIDELEIWSTKSRGDDKDETNVALASLGATARASGTLPGFAIHKLEHLNDGQYGNGRSWISNTSGRGWVEIELPHVATIGRIVWGRDREGQYRDRVATRYKIEVSRDQSEWTTVASSDDRLPFGSTLEDLAKGVDLATNRPDLAPKSRERVRSLLGDLARATRELEEAKSELVALTAWAGRFSEPPPTYVLYRGDPLSPQEEVGPGALSVLGDLEIARDAPDSKRRLALARWITRDDNPLTARVIVNRLWQYVFGEGIVSTPNDFGANGVPPSHPELLDFLARDLIESGWSMKQVVRQLVLSSTFRQAALRNDRAVRIDGANRLLWRFAPRRLEAEAIRDSILSVSGVLDPRMGGPGFEVVVAMPGNVYNYDTKREFSPEDWRRSVYGHRIRGERDGTFDVFDCPDGGQITPERSRSTTALQALSLLNSPFVIEQAGILAKRIESLLEADARAHRAGSPGGSAEAEVDIAFRLAFQRSPDREEIASARRVVEEQGLATLARVLFNTNEFLFIP